MCERGREKEREERLKNASNYTGAQRKKEITREREREKEKERTIRRTSLYIVII